MPCQDQTDNHRHRNDRRNYSYDDLFGIRWLFRQDWNEFQRIMFRVVGNVFDGASRLGCGIRSVVGGRHIERLRNG